MILMNNTTRKLNPKQRAATWKRIQASLANGVPITNVARENQVSPALVYRIKKKFSVEGEAGLEPKRRGRPEHLNKMLEEDESKLLKWKTEPDQDWIERHYIGNMLRDLNCLMEKNGITKTALSRKIGKSDTYVSLVYKHPGHISLNACMSMFFALGVGLKFETVPTEEIETTFAQRKADLILADPPFNKIEPQNHRTENIEDQPTIPAKDENS